VKGHFHFFLTRQSANVLAKIAPGRRIMCAIVIAVLVPVASYSQDTGYISGTSSINLGAAIAAAMCVDHTAGSLTRATTTNGDAPT